MLNFPCSLFPVLAGLLDYSFSPINYDFNQLTEKEKDIFGDAETFKAFVEWAQKGSPKVDDPPSPYPTAEVVQGREVILTDGSVHFFPETEEGAQALAALLRQTGHDTVETHEHDEFLSGALELAWPEDVD